MGVLDMQCGQRGYNKTLVEKPKSTMYTITDFFYQRTRASSHSEPLSTNDGKRKFDLGNQSK